MMTWEDYVKSVDDVFTLYLCKECGNTAVGKENTRCSECEEKHKKKVKEKLDEIEKI
jgi:rubrerythrin